MWCVIAYQIASTALVGIVQNDLPTYDEALKLARHVESISLEIAAAVRQGSDCKNPPNYYFGD